MAGDGVGDPLRFVPGLRERQDEMVGGGTDGVAREDVAAVVVPRPLIDLRCRAGRLPEMIEGRQLVLAVPAAEAVVVNVVGR